MKNSTYIVGGLFVAFIVFITMRGELPRYLGVIGIGSGGSTIDPKWNLGGGIF